MFNSENVAALGSLEEDIRKGSILLGYKILKQFIQH